MLEKVVILCFVATFVSGGGAPADKPGPDGYVPGRYGPGGYGRYGHDDYGRYGHGGYGRGHGAGGYGGYDGNYGGYRGGPYRGPAPGALPKTPAEIAAKTGRLPLPDAGPLAPVAPLGPVGPGAPIPPGKTPEEIALKRGRPDLVPVGPAGPAPGPLGPLPGPGGPIDPVRDGPGYGYRGGYRGDYGGKGYYGGDPVGPPRPYNTDYNFATHDGGAVTQTEQGNELGFKTGSYTIRTADGLYRIVDYVADDAGFRATIRTNEPGTDNKNPADVNVIAEVSPVNYPPSGNYGYGSRPYGPGNRPGGYDGYGGAKPFGPGSYDGPAGPGGKPYGGYPRDGPAGPGGKPYGGYPRDGPYGGGYGGGYAGGYRGDYGPGYSGKSYKKPV